MQPDDAQLLDRLIAARRLTREQAAWLVAEQGRRGEPLATLLLEQRVVSPGELAPTMHAAASTEPDERTLAPPDERALAPPDERALAPPDPQDATRLTPALERTGASMEPGVALGPAADLPPEVRQAMADPSRRIGRYVVLGELGRGGMGVVLRAFDPTVGRAVAIKQLQDGAGGDQLERFRREIAATGKLRHAAIVAIHEVGLHQGRPFLVMELVDGQTLHALLEAGTLTTEQALGIVREMALALDHAHGHGIIHRDIKPGNVLVDRELRPRIVDFGLARQRHAERLTQTGQVVGTLTTMAPEQASGEHQSHGPETDVYALGAILHRVLTGSYPFAAASTMQAQLKAIIFEAPTPCSKHRSGIDPRLDELVLECLEKETVGRPTALQVASVLGDVLANPPASRRGATRIVAIALGALVIGLGAVAWRSSSSAGVETPPSPPPTTLTTSPEQASVTPPTPTPTPRPTPPSTSLDAAWAGRTRSREGKLELVGQTGKLVWNNGTPVQRLAVTEAGRQVVSSGSSAFRRWDVATGQVLVDIECRIDDVPGTPADPLGGDAADRGEAVAVSPDGRLAARGDRSGRILLQRGEEPTASVLAVLPRADVQSLLFDEAGLLAGTQAGKVVWIDTNTGELRPVFEAQGAVRGLARLPDGTLLVVAGGTLYGVVGAEADRLPLAGGRDASSVSVYVKDGQPRIAATTEAPAPAAEPPMRPGALGGREVLDCSGFGASTFLGPGRLLLLGQGGAQIHDLGNGNVERFNVPPTRTVVPVHGGFVTGSHDGWLRPWSLEGRPRPRSPGALGAVTDLSVTPDGRRVVSGHDHQAVHVWDPATGAGREIDTRGPARLAVAVDDRRLAFLTDRLWVMDLDDPARLEPGPPSPGNLGPPYGCFRLAPGRIVSFHADGTVLLWSVDGQEVGAIPAWRGPLPRGAPFALWSGCASPDGRTLAFGRFDGEVLLVDSVARTTRELGRHDGAAPARGIAFISPEQLASGGQDRAVRLWRTGEPRAEDGVLRGATRAVVCVALVADGRLLTGSADGRLRLLTLDGDPVDQLDLGPTDAPVALTATADGRRVYVGTSRGLVLALDVR